MTVLILYYKIILSLLFYKNMKIMFPGSFDPFTIGHENLILRAIDIFKNNNKNIEFYVAIGKNSNKNSHFSLDRRIASLIEWSKNFISEHKLEDICKIFICCYDNLTFDFAEKIKADFILRGIRNTIDFEYEKNIADFNKKFGNIETLMLMNEPAKTESSTFVRELIKNDKFIEASLSFPKGYNILNVKDVSTIISSNKEMLIK